MNNIYFYLLLGVLLYIIFTILIENYYYNKLEQENFDPSLVPVSSIVTLAKVAQKIVNGNGVLSNPGNLQIGVSTSTPGNLSVTGDSTLTGNTTISGTLNAGPSTLSSANVTGALNAGATTLSSLTVSNSLGAGATTVSGLNVNGNSTLSGSLNAGASTLSNTTVSGTLNAGASTLSSANITGSLNAGDSTLGNTNVTGTLGAGTTTLGTTTINGDLTVNNGTLTSDNAIVNGWNVIESFFKIRLLDAWYDSPMLRQPMDVVTNTLNSYINTANNNRSYSFSFSSPQNAFGDTRGYQTKIFYFAWACGKMKREATWGENDPVTISCP